MKCTCRISLFICAAAAIAGATGVTMAAGLLNAQSFPKTANDTSFIERMQNLASGYDEFDTLYDSNGNCISGCAYQGIKLEDALSASKRATEAANAALAAYQATHSEGTTPQYNDTPAPDTEQPTHAPEDTHENPTQPGHHPPVTEPENQPPFTPPDIGGTDNIGGGDNNNSEYKCPTGKYSRYIPRGNTVVNRAPIDTDLIITSDVGERSVSGGTSWHQGIDLRASDGTDVYMPANGEVTFVGGSNTSGTGYYIWVYHPAEKIYTRYLHLSDISLVKKGDKIQGGCLFAKSEHSGRGRNKKPYSAHLHYEIKQSQTSNRPDVIDPFWGGINRLGRAYRFKSRDTMRKTRKGVPPTGCVGFLS